NMRASFEFGLKLAHDEPSLHSPDGHQRTRPYAEAGVTASPPFWCTTAWWRGAKHHHKTSTTETGRAKHHPWLGRSVLFGPACARGRCRRSQEDDRRHACG